MRVVATQTGYYNNMIREVGEVFDLLSFPDGSYPPKTKEVIVDGKPVLKPVKLKDGKTTAHRDFAPDQGVRVIKSGPLKGEIVQSGWMRIVPDSVHVGFYPPGTDFWTPNAMRPPPVPRSIGPQDRRATQIATHLEPTAAPDIEELEDT